MRVRTEFKNLEGELWELQLKGSGLTPYSRTADGRAVLRSSIREYLCSEAMFALGIPTTRAASLVVSDSKVHRDLLYDGNIILEKCSIVMRVAPSFLRFGSFEIFKKPDPFTGMWGPSEGKTKEMMPAMLNYLIQTHFPKALEKFGITQNSEIHENPEVLLEFYKEVVEKTARLVAKW
jgi:uncharacterized protein YdiU (UPF0061 family)